MALTNRPVSASRAPANGLLDLLPPKVLQFAALSPKTVDVSSTDSKIDFEITVQDDISGLAEVFVFAFADYEYPFVSITSFPPADGKPVQLKFSMPISKYVRGGVWRLAIDTVDVAGNQMRLNSNVMAELNYTYDIEVINSKIDTAPPKLLNFVALTPLTVNSTRGPSTVLFQLTVQDDFSGVEGVYLTTDSRGNNRDYRNLEHSSGVPLLVNFTQDYQKLAPGTYSMVVQLDDRAGNRALYPQQNLTKLGFPSTITVVN
jgi:hypothetical protein